VTKKSLQLSFSWLYGYLYILEDDFTGNWSSQNPFFSCRPIVTPGLLLSKSVPWHYNWKWAWLYQTDFQPIRSTNLAI